ncbi:DNA-3-methyladenine glycosylase I [Photobacterium sp. MCCC 1A19761]|uniref:DNA-3-methyladenine glycosylase I n=1 Tax=Photobacterium sp. MCCC 1A19761 TaxID=3115000 RepID=UPI00307F6BC7
MKRCPWVDESKPDYVAYHDLEWGVPVYDDQKIFEFLVLESAQAGLSWYTILKKRANYRDAFAEFDPKRVATFTDDDVERLMNNPGIVRNRRKIEAAINNARCFLAVQEAFGTFADYIWSFVEGGPKTSALRGLSDYPATTPESDRLAKDMKKRGFKFLGSTTLYAHMQATGMVNDHSLDCFRRAELLADQPEY